METFVGYWNSNLTHVVRKQPFRHMTVSLEEFLETAFDFCLNRIEKLSKLSQIFIFIFYNSFPPQFVSIEIEIGLPEPIGENTSSPISFRALGGTADCVDIGYS